MKSYNKIVLLVAIALFLTLTACTRQASKTTVSPATSTEEAPFPFTTPGGVANFGTQTAIALTPQSAVDLTTATPVVLVSTATPSAEEGGNTETGGGQTVEETPTAGPVIDTPVVARPATYSLQQGEWPLCIARRYGLDIDTFFQLNGFNMNSKPSAGTSVKLPASGGWNNSFGSPSLQKHPVNYTVVAGDTLYKIACRYGDVTPEAILAVNSLTSASAIKAGMTLQIP